MSNIDDKILLQANNISYESGGRQILRNISLDLFKGETTTLIGPNGAGKTTLLRVLLGLIPPSEGKVVKKPNLRIGYLPQRTQIDPVIPLSVARLMTLTGHYTRKAVQQALDETGVSSLINESVFNLSGGEFQRVMLARALLRRPELLVLDEPVQSVDYLGETELYKLIGNISQKHSCAVLMISHDLHVVMGSTDKVICLDQHICCEGEPCDVSAHPEYLRLFGLDTHQKGQESTFAIYNHQHDHTHDISGHTHELTNSSSSIANGSCDKADGFYLKTGGTCDSSHENHHTDTAICKSQHKDNKKLGSE